jgi:hypothetical protein
MGHTGERGEAGRVELVGLHQKKERLVGWAGFRGKPGFGPWPVLAIGKLFFFYKLFLNRELF